MLQKRKGSEDLLAGLPESLLANLKKPQIRKSDTNLLEEPIPAPKTSPKKEVKENADKKVVSKAKEVPKKKEHEKDSTKIIKKNEVTKKDLLAKPKKF